MDQCCNVMLCWYSSSLMEWPTIDQKELKVVQCVKKKVIVACFYRTRHDAGRYSVGNSG